MSTNTNTGTVKFFNSQKGFGFIQPDGGGPDVFVHVTALERAGIRSLAEGQKVSYDTEIDRKNGKTAVRMQREGIFREIKRRRAYEKPSERRVRERAEAIRRAKKLARRKAQKEGLLPFPKARPRSEPVRSFR